MATASREAEIRRRALGLLTTARRLRPGPPTRAWLDDCALGWSMEHPALQRSLFHFAEALPGLTSPGTTAQRYIEHLAPVARDLPWPLPLVATTAPIARLAGAWAHTFAGIGAQRFISGRDAGDALTRLERQRALDRAITVDWLGETVLSPDESNAYRDTCEALLHTLAAARWTANPADGGQPPVQLSLKLTALGHRIDEVAPEAAARVILPRLRRVLQTARNLGAGVCIDMEHHAVQPLTLHLVKTVLMEDDFRDWSEVGLAVQAYLTSAEDDLVGLAVWAERRGTPLRVRLVKGAYVDQERIWAAQAGWPCPTWESKGATDACYERCVAWLCARADVLRPAFATHNARSLACCLVHAEAAGLDGNAWEAQMLLGMDEGLARAVTDAGIRLRMYCPIGDLVAGMAYLVRRLLENTSNQSFVRAATFDRRHDAELVRAPDPAPRPDVPAPVNFGEPRMPVPFSNHPLLDFSIEAARERFHEAVHARFAAGPAELAPWIGGVMRPGPGRREIRAPADTRRVLAHVVEADAGLAMNACDALARAWPAWRDRSAADRAKVLATAADRINRDRFALAALIVDEAGKSWRDADADVAEAIDFLRFYGQEMVRLATPQLRDLPGEANRTWYEARGVAAVIAPWNFPLAILAGMAGAALAAGCAVALKPAEQTPLTAWRLVQHLLAAGVPADCLAYLPGPGETVGDALVRHPAIAVIAFTGSQAAGLSISQAAAASSGPARQMKHVIAEMGGKNAIIVDEDADADESIAGILRSAFGFQGQKCSACSRLVIVGSAYERIMPRLISAAESLTLGSPSEPGSDLGPLIDEEALTRVERICADADRRLTRVVPVGNPAVPAASLPPGHWLRARIYTDVPADDPLWLDEVFAPVLAVARVATLEQALERAQLGAYALTGGLFTRSPQSIAIAIERFRVGNLYLNRAITGALVDRQPFGGHRLSGTGPKAGSADYLLPFLVQRTVSENRLRHGLVDG